jgi:hypothetical protein
MSTELGFRNPGRMEAAAAVIAAGLVVLVSWLAGQGFATDSPRDFSTLVSASGETIALDVSGTVTADQVERCLMPTFARRVDDVTVLYGQVQRSEAGDVAALILRNDEGDLRLCDSFGGTSPSSTPVVLASAREPVRYLTNTRQSWNCDGSRLAGFTVSQWLSVTGRVGGADLRFVVDGEPGPWLRTDAHGGFVHLHGWLGDQGAGARIRLQMRVLDGLGGVVMRQAVPVSACTGGDVQLG